VGGQGRAVRGRGRAPRDAGDADLGLPDAVRAKDRFGGVEGVDRLARILSVQLGLPEDVVREPISDLLDQGLRVEISPGLWITAAGGVLLVAGGVLGLAWAGRRGPPDGAVG
jgi:hypothetical protein